MSYRLKNIVLAAALAAAAALLVTFYVANYRRSVQQGEENVTVYVAAGTIAEGTSGGALADRKLFRTEQVPQRTVVAGAIASPDDVDDLVVAQPIYEGEQITKQRFRTLQEEGIRAELTGNVRALQVAGDANQLLAGTLKRGDRVDVVASLKYKIGQVTGDEESTVGGDSDRTASRVVLRDLLVLRAPSTSLAADKVSSNVGASSVQLAVSDAQAQKLFYVTKNGDWTLQLRPVVDAADSPDSVETIESVLGDGLRPAQYAQLYTGRRGR